MTLLAPLVLTTFLVTELPVLFETPLSPRIANYRIEVTLKPTTGQLLGKQMLLWTNTTPDPVYDLRFHTYLNAFRNTQSTFVGESEGSHRGNQMEKWGYMEPSQIRIQRHEGPPVNDFSDASNHPDPAAMAGVTASWRYLQPDDGNRFDKTYGMVPLVEPLEPGDSIWVYFTFTAQLPAPPFARTGRVGDFFLVAQWFPKIAVFENGGWTDHQFHLNTEFYADFGVYDVFMTVPSDYVVGATGVPVSQTGTVDETTHYYHAEDVHDFAWTACPDFVVGERTVQDVAVRALVHRSHEDQMKRHLDAAETAITSFQNNWGDYPYPNLTVVDPAPGAEGAGGMEYPTLITAGSAAHTPAGLRDLEVVIIHEFGHQYWYGLLASNEFEEAWLDEGINTYTELLIMDEVYGGVVDLAGLVIRDVDVTRMIYAGGSNIEPTVMPAWQHYSNQSYGINAYHKPGLALMTLHNHLGGEMMRDILRAYVSRFRFTHPTTADFIAVANEVSGEDLSWFFEQALFSRAELDYAVDEVVSRRVRSDRGYDFTLDSGPGTTRPPVAEGAYENKVAIRRLGDFVFPVTLELRFADGSRRTETWSGEAPWKIFRFGSDVPLEAAVIDPDNGLVLDVDQTNNRMSIDADMEPGARAGVWWWKRLQLLFDVISF